VLGAFHSGGAEDEVAGGPDPGGLQGLGMGCIAVDGGDPRFAQAADRVEVQLEA